MKKVHVTMRCFPLLIALSVFPVLYGLPVLAHNGMEGNGGLTAGGPRADGMDGNPLTARAEAPPHPTQDTSALSVSVSDIVVDGGFDEFVDVTEQFIAPFRGRRATVEQLHALAQAVELLYHEAGYFLVRVTIPPQEVNDGDPFHLTIIDGYFEGLELQGVPPKPRSYIESLLKTIVNRPRLTMRDFERAVMLARQTPGLSIRTTQVAGGDVGSALLVVDGDRSGFGGSASFSSRLSDADALWNASVQIQLNQPFGRGEQFTANVSGPASSLFLPMGPEANNRTVGGSVRWPLNNSGMSLQFGYTQSDTYTPSPHWLIPPTRTEFRRFSLELSELHHLTRSSELRVTTTLDETQQHMEAPDFAAIFHRDGLRVLRLGANARHDTTSGSRLSLSFQLSQGLAWGSRSVKDVLESGIPFSRLGAAPTFQKMNLTASARVPFTSGFALTSTLRAQYALTGPLPSTELFSISGHNALPSLAFGMSGNDIGWTLREEVDRSLSLLDGRLRLLLYGYAAAGATAYNADSMTRVATAAGFGMRADVGRARLSLEYAAGRVQATQDDAVVATLEVSF